MINDNGNQLSFLQSLVDTINLPMVVVGVDMRIRFINAAAASLFADKITDTAVGENCYSFMFGQEKSCVRLGKCCPLVDCRESGGTIKTEFKMEGQDEFPRYYEIIATALYSESGEFLGVVEAFHDITDWKLFERWLKSAQKDSENLVREQTTKLLESNRHLRQEVQERQRTEVALLRARRRSELLYRVIPSAIFTVDLNRRITSWNDKAEALTGFTREEIVGKSCSVFAMFPCTEQCGMYSDSIAKPIVGRECIIRTKDGQRRTISKNGDFLLDDDGNVMGAVESFEDITDIKKVEEQLISEHDKLKGMLAAMRQSMHILGPDYIIEYQNDEAKAAFGDRYGEECYRVYRDRETPCEECLMQAAINTESIQRVELMMGNNTFYDQSYTPFMDVDNQAKVLVLLRDITEEKLLQAETLRAVQLASVGQLAAGVAHEINNPINGIINYAQIIQDEAGGNEVLSDISEKIIREGERVANIVSNLLSFARQKEDKSEEINLVKVVHDTVELIRYQLSRNCIILDMDFPETLPSVFGHHQRLQQVFLNLVSNARFALNQRFSGKNPRKKLTVSGEEIELEGRRYVRIVFEDMGTGIPAEKVDKIFEPFYSSKTQGEGTGLGLSISREIIIKHGGDLHVETQEGEYTKMIVDLPVYDGHEGKVSDNSSAGKAHD
ncbi:MAG: PAS domain-containing protein [Desulfobulbaceae bacterium]|nr:PAS domain-containing protein [Desulfobulbaceae bacterium]